MMMLETAIHCLRLFMWRKADRGDPYSDSELRSACRARHSLDLVVATVTPVFSAISFIEASDR